MDGHRFDNLVRRFAEPRTTRRDLLGLVVGVGAALVGGGRSGAGAQAIGCPPGQTANRKGDCRCPAGTAACPTGCFDRNRDINNCGTCGAACQRGATCIKGECRCPSGASACGGVCRSQASFTSDPDNCGSCGAACPSAAPGTCQGARICTSGQCGFAPAQDGTDCNADGDACTVGDLCQAGTCVAGTPQECPSCQACAGGACSPVSTDARCVTVCCGGVCCPDGQTCAGGVCQAICVRFGETCDPATDACCQDEPSACVQTCGGAPTCCHSPGGVCGDNCDCCGLDTCDFEAGTCCRERGGSCANGESCCGLLGCAGGVCCLLIGSGICAEDAECCGDAVCGADGFCAPPFCLAVGSACAPEGEPCCREGAVPSTCETVCDGVETCCNAPGGSCGSNCHCCGLDTCDFDGNVCCREIGGSCAAGEPCCGVLPCVGGVCCQEVGGGGCDADIDCCGDLVCREGVCEAAICGPPQTPCNPAGENTCCQVGGYTVCQEAVGCSDGEPWCCRHLGGACTADCDCCGEFDGCGIDGRCCRGLGGACSETKMCCADGVCDAGAGGTCRLPDGAFCAFDEECRAGARCVDNACRSAV